MNDLHLTRPTEADFAAAKDPGFRARAVVEYQRVKAWSGISLDTARILDFGCGQGIAAASFAIRHPGAVVTGLDIEPVRLNDLASVYRSQLGRDLPPNVGYAALPAGQLPDGQFDIIYAWSVFQQVQEHHMVGLFKTLKRSLAPNGRLFVQVDPLYFSARGSLLYNYFKSPWHHLILPLDVLRDGVLSNKPTPKETREWAQFLALNRLTAQDIIARATEAGLRLTKQAAFTRDEVPPPRLTRIYNPDALVTNEFMALFG